MTDDLFELDAVTVADGVRRGELRAADVLEHHLERIERLNPDLNAFVFLDADRARRVAAAIDAQVDAGENPGPLAGVPLGIKELESVEGWPDTRASVVFRDRVGTATTVMSSRLLAAGAVPVGLTASPEWGLLFFTNSNLHGVTRNPWKLDRTPGGSSGGAGAALAAGLVPLATGSDMGGSIRLPAGWCGVVGVKGTYGRVPRSPGYIGGSNMIHYGPLARSVTDAARYLDCVCGVDGRDPGSLPVPAVPFEQALNTSLVGLKAAVALETNLTPADADVRTVVSQAAAELIKVAELEEVGGVRLNLPPLNTLGGAIIAADLDPEVAPLFGEIAASIASTEGAAPLLALAADPTAMTLEGVASFNAMRHQLNQALAEIFERVDLLLLPTSPVPAPGAAGPVPTVVDGREVGASASGAFTYPFNISGHPVVSVPAGMVDGAPVGMQIVARRHEDALALAAAYAFEKAKPWPKLAPMARG